MPEKWQQGDWLLIDAAGPELVVGITRHGNWIEFSAARDGFLESLKPSLESLLGKQDLTLPALAGCLYASGPGSTLGLRLAALFLRSLLQLPQLSHWACLVYNNLALACADQFQNTGFSVSKLAAPWRKDRLHLVSIDPLTRNFELSSASPESVASGKLQWVMLGNRPTRFLPEELAISYPAERIPGILRQFPQLLDDRAFPEPYSAEAATFVRWTPERHSAP